MGKTRRKQGAEGERGGERGRETESRTASVGREEEARSEASRLTAADHRPQHKVWKDRSKGPAQPAKGEREGRQRVATIVRAHSERGGREGAGGIVEGDQDRVRESIEEKLLNLGRGLSARRRRRERLEEGRTGEEGKKRGAGA